MFVGLCSNHDVWEKLFTFTRCRIRGCGQHKLKWFVDGTQTVRSIGQPTAKAFFTGRIWCTFCLLLNCVFYYIVIIIFVCVVEARIHFWWKVPNRGSISRGLCRVMFVQGLSDLRVGARGYKNCIAKWCFLNTMSSGLCDTFCFSQGFYSSLVTINLNDC